MQVPEPLSKYSVTQYSATVDAQSQPQLPTDSFVRGRECVSALDCTRISPFIVRPAPRLDLAQFSRLGVSKSQNEPSLPAASEDHIRNRQLAMHPTSKAFVQSPSLCDLLDDAPEETVIFLDIDRTLLRKGHKDNPVVVEGAHVPLHLARLQSEGIVMLGLTARPPHMKDAILHALDVVGIDLKLTCPLSDGTALDTDCPTLVEGGVIFCGDANSKGSVLASVHGRFPLRRAMAVDDRVGNFWSLLHASRANDIDMTLAHYTGDLGGEVHGQDEEWAQLVEHCDDDAFLKVRAISHFAITAERRRKREKNL